MEFGKDMHAIRCGVFSIPRARIVLHRFILECENLVQKTEQDCIQVPEICFQMQE